jgi:hypothetical protein
LSRGVSEKNATSEPDTRAEMHSNKQVITNIVITCGVMP